MNTNLPSNHTSITPNRKVGHLTVNQTSSNERCPICDRSFGPKAFDRHVEFCKEQKNRVQVHKSPAVVQQAKERLEARINYRVPPLRQSKRNLIRDKYSPSSQTNLLHRSNTIVSGKSTTSLASSVTTMLPNRRQPVNNNEKIIERNNKKDLGSKIRVDRAIGDCGDTKQAMKNDNNGNKSPESLKNKSSRMIGTGSLSKQTGLEFGKVRAEGLDEITPREETVNLNRTPTAEELYPDNPAMYEEFRKYEEMYRREKEGKSSSSKKQRKKTADFGINIEDASKTYEDSTYGRKQQMEEQEVDQVEELVRNMLPTATTPGERLPKYCHECGNKYPVATAKFCVECGIKRLVL